MPNVNPQPSPPPRNAQEAYEFFHRIVDDTAAQLSEWFGSVQICCSSVAMNGGTNTWFAGRGDWNARLGLCNNFVRSDAHNSLAFSIAKQLQPPPDDFRNFGAPV